MLFSCPHRKWKQFWFSTYSMCIVCYRAVELPWCNHKEYHQQVDSFVVQNHCNSDPVKWSALHCACQFVVCSNPASRNGQIVSNSLRPMPSKFFIKQWRSLITYAGCHCSSGPVQVQSLNECCQHKLINSYLELRSAQIYIFTKSWKRYVALRSIRVQDWSTACCQYSSTIIVDTEGLKISPWPCGLMDKALVLLSAFWARWTPEIAGSIPARVVFTKSYQCLYLSAFFAF